MPYVPSEKTPNPSGVIKDGKAQDRVLIDKEVLALSKTVADKITTNNEILRNYLQTFLDIGSGLVNVNECEKEVKGIVEVINQVSDAYGYEGAFLGELNYTITRLIQEVPKRLVEQGKQKSELRYFIYALTVEALIKASNYFSLEEGAFGIGGVFEDIKDEYKRRVNTSYEVAQIIKSGDCYDTPYLTQPAEVVDQNGKVVGHVEVMITRDNYNGKDVSGKIRIEK